MDCGEATTPSRPPQGLGDAGLAPPRERRGRRRGSLSPYRPRSPQAVTASAANQRRAHCDTRAHERRSTAAAISSTAYSTAGARRSREATRRLRRHARGHYRSHRSARCRLRAERALTFLGFHTLDAAVRAGLALRQHGPVGRRLTRPAVAFRHAKRRAANRRARHCKSTFEADTEREAKERAWGGASKLLRRERHPPRTRRTDVRPGRSAHIRSVRDTAVSGLYAAGGPQTAGVHRRRRRAGRLDAGIPHRRASHPESGFEISGTLLVHVADRTSSHAAATRSEQPRPTARNSGRLREAVHGLAAVARRHGQHAARHRNRATPWVERQYGPLVPVFRELKRIFDPKGILNPGKIVGPDPSREAWPCGR